VTTPLEAALGYAAFCGVLPCTARKVPIKIEGVFEHGVASATTDAAVITKVWTEYKAADIGLALPSGVLVVDVDVAKGKQGRDDFIRLFGCPPEEMATAVATTASGGWHVYFGFDPSLQLVQTTITSSLDVRIGGLGYVIAPSPGNGRHWVRPLLTTQLMESPQWLLERLRRASEAEPGEAKPFKGQTSGRAQEALNRACATLAGPRDSRRHDRPGRLSRRQAGGGGRTRS
jgi:Bifunctional DNA primase/polymerase, N-terminal